MIGLFDPTPITRPLTDTQLVALIKAATAELFLCAPEFGAIEDALVALEDAVADLNVQMQRAESGELAAEERQARADGLADYRYEMMRDSRSEAA